MVTTDAGSAVLALEIDEGTEHRRTIRAKLAAYRRPLATVRTGIWWSWFQPPIRAAWMVRVAASLDLGPRSWVVTRTDLEPARRTPCFDHSTRGQSPRSIRSLLKPPRRLSPAPVGSHAWLELLRPAVARQRTVPSRRRRRRRWGILVRSSVGRDISLSQGWFRVLVNMGVVGDPEGLHEATRTVGLGHARPVSLTRHEGSAAYPGCGRKADEKGKRE